MRPPEKIRAEDAKKWIDLALKDLEVGNLLIKKGIGYWDFALFHFQQSVEKSIKAFLVWNDRSFKKIHFLGTLGQVCISIDPSLDESLRNVDVLSKYAVDARYPGEMVEHLTKDHVKEAVEITEQVLKEILKRLPKEAQPEKKSKFKRSSRPTAPRKA